MCVSFKCACSINQPTLNCCSSCLLLGHSLLQTQAIEAEKAAKIAAEEARNSQKFDKPTILAYLSNKDKKFLRMKDGRG